MKFLFAGCSFCYGSELTDREDNRYSRLISNHFNAEELNIGKRSSSNHNIIYDAYDVCKMNNDITHAFINLTHIVRFMIPGTQGFININPNYGAKRTKGNANSKVSMMSRLIKLVYESAHSSVNWYDYYIPMFEMFEYYCKSKGIKTYYSFNKELDKDAFMERTNFCCFPNSFEEYKKIYGHCPLEHPNEKCHKEFAESYCKFIETKL